MTATTITEESMEVTPHDLDDARKPPLSPLGILLMNFGFESSSASVCNSRR